MRPGDSPACAAILDANAPPASALTAPAPAYRERVAASSSQVCPKLGGTAVCDGDCRCCPYRGR